MIFEHDFFYIEMEMTCIECGIPYAQVDTEAICKGYRLAFPEHMDELEEWLKGEDEYSEPPLISYLP